jgi:hypothetical protein
MTLEVEVIMVYEMLIKVMVVENLNLMNLNLKNWMMNYLVNLTTKVLQQVNEDELVVVVELRIENRLY